MADVSIAEAKAKLSEIVAAVEAGETHVITRRGKVVAKIVPADAHVVAPRSKLDIDALRGHIARLIDDGNPVADADDFLRRWKSEQRY